jgi:hypothetical protein
VDCKKLKQLLSNPIASRAVERLIRELGKSAPAIVQRTIRALLVNGIASSQHELGDGTDLPPDTPVKIPNDHANGPDFR